MTKPKLVLTLPEYERIFRVIYSVLDGHANIPHACVFFSFVGACILETKYKLKATPIAGAALYRFEGSSIDVLTYGAFENDLLISHNDAFHCWIECEGFIIDFMSPIFKESFESVGHKKSIPRNMFQRPLNEMAPTLEDLKNPGDFAFLPNAELTKELLSKFISSPATTDLANICLEWFTKYPKPLPPMKMIDDLGEIFPIIPKGPPVTGAW